MPRIDLNCDLGEREDAESLALDLRMLEHVTSANIACGAHAGDDATMRAVIEVAMVRGVAIGAHPSYPDRAGFGRRSMPMTPAQIEASVHEQVAHLQRLARARAATLHHVKPHGALYHDASRDPDIARAIARGARAVRPDLILVGFAGSGALDVWRAMGMGVAGEVFADRRYEPDGSLRDRDALGGPRPLIDDPAAAGAQAVGLALRGAPSGASRIGTICVHSDTPGAPVIAAHVARALRDAGFTLAPLARPL